MIRRKFLATLTAASVMASMYAVSAFATAPEWNNEGGETTAEGISENFGPTFEVAVPEDLYFGINPFELDLDDEDLFPDKQIVSTDYVIYNYSNIPVKIDTVTNVTAAGNFDVVDQYLAHPSTKVLTPSTNSGKVSVLLLQKLPTGITVGTDETVTMTYSPAPITGSATITADDYAKEQCAQVLTGTAIGTISFGLDAFTDTLKVGNVSGFTFDGAVDATTPLTESDTLTVKTVFTLHSMSKADYTDGYEVNKVYSGTHTSVLGEKK